MKWKHVLGHNTSCTHCYTSTKRNPRKDNHITSEPAVLAYSDWFTELRAIDAISQKRVKRMCGGIEGAIRSDEGTWSDGDQTGVKESAIEIDIYSSSDSAEDGSVGFYQYDSRMWVSYLRLVP